MPFSTIVLPFLRGASCVALATWYAIAHAQAQAGMPGDVVQTLPELAGATARAPGYFGIQPNIAELGYATRIEKWSAKLDQYLRPNANIKLDYGLQLTSKIGAGGVYLRQSSYAEVVLNGVYAPQPNVRLRVSGSQTRSADGLTQMSGSDAGAILQNSYLLSARKYWNKYQFLSDLGITAYSTEAHAPSSAPDVTDSETGNPESGRKDGYALNLGLRPTSHSRLELRREISHLSYLPGVDLRHGTQLTADRVKYAHFLDNCVRLQGRLTTNTDGGRLDLNVARNNWNVNLSRAQHGDDTSTAIQIGYAVSLGARPLRSPTCVNAAEKPPMFESVVDASAGRLMQHSREPLFVDPARLAAENYRQ